VESDARKKKNTRWCADICQNAALLLLLLLLLIAVNGSLEHVLHIVSSEVSLGRSSEKQLESLEGIA
jgi:hypothetical protein